MVWFQIPIRVWVYFIQHHFSQIKLGLVWFSSGLFEFGSDSGHLNSGTVRVIRFGSIFPGLIFRLQLKKRTVFSVKKGTNYLKLSDQTFLVLIDFSLKLFSCGYILYFKIILK